ncbi:MAG: energy transducer TonB [Gammaproteobacteria bacterium]
MNGAEEAPSTQDVFSNPDLTGISGDAQRLNPDGERALRLALQAIEKNQPVDHKRRGDTLLELGDWYMSAGGLARGVDTYREAWKDYLQAGDTTVLTQPRLLAYRPPPSSSKRSSLKPDDAEEHFVEVKFSVTKDGRTDDVQLSGGDAPESSQRATVTAVKKARYSPKFEAGEAVETQGVTIREKILVKAKSSSGS